MEQRSGIARSGSQKATDPLIGKVVAGRYRLEARLGPIPRTPLRQGIADTYERFARLRDEGQLDLADLG